MKTEFVLRIDLSNYPSLEDANLADVITEVARDIEFIGISSNRSYDVRAYNGKVVGSYGRYTSEEEVTA